MFAYNGPMRTLRIIIDRSKGVLPVLVLATLLPAGASCGGGTEQGSSGSVSGAGGASSTSSSQGIGGGLVSSSSASGAGGADGGTTCDLNCFSQTMTVQVPPDGVPASPGQICAVMMVPIESNHAARVTLTKYSPALNMAMGFVAIDPALAGSIVGLPTIQVVQADTPELLPMTVTNVQPAAGGFSFHAEWPPPFLLCPESWARMKVKTTLTVACDPMAMDTRVVEAFTFIDLCIGDMDLTWVSSGDMCKECAIIAEMAPSPIVPDASADELPLARVMRLRITVLARVGGTLVLLAENDGGSGLSYAWRPSGGEISELAPDVIVWTPPIDPGPHLIQAIIEGNDAAAVASFTYQEAA